MAWKEVPEPPPPRVGPCDVCVLVHDRHEPRETTYCVLCDSWLCQECKGAWTWRAVAAVKRLLTKKG